MFDTYICLFNNLTQRHIVDMEHTGSIHLISDQPGTVVFQETVAREQATMSTILTHQYEHVSSATGSVKVPQAPKKDLSNYQSSAFEKVGLSGPPTGVSILEWSYDSVYLATKCETMPTAVWIWDTTTLSLHTVLIHQNNVKSLKFAPHSLQLLIGTGQQRVHMWTPHGSCIVALPDSKDQTSGVNVYKIQWNPRGTNILLSDKHQGILGFPSADLMNGVTTVKPMAG